MTTSRGRPEGRPDIDAPLVISGGRVIDPARGVDRVEDVWIVGGRVTAAAPRNGRVRRLDASGLIVCPGFVDMHVHLREPGQEHKETVATGVAAAVAGGFTTVACMPNTDPVNDQAGVTELVLAQAAAAGLARVHPIGAVTKGSAGEALAEIGDLRAAGCVAISDDGRPVASALMMRRALEYASMFDLPVIDHCEEPTLKADGVAHEGPTAARLGLRGIPAAAEAIMVGRDVELAALTGGRVHIPHMSARESLELVRAGKRRGARVTCEVTPHHLTLTDEALEGYDTNVKMNPPLRGAADRDALIEGLADGSIDALATDHAPHHEDEKRVEFDRAPFGIVGLETAIPIMLDRFVATGIIGLARLVEICSVNPAAILNLPGGSLGPGAPGDVTILALDAETLVDPERFRSKGRNTPFTGWRLHGSPAITIVGGAIVCCGEAFTSRIGDA